MNNLYRTRDFYSAVILRTLGFHLVELERGDGRFVTFVFSDKDRQAESMLADYWNRNLNVIARDLVDNIGELKTRMYSES